MKRPSEYQKTQNRRKRGFERASGLMQSRIRTASESRGFAVSRLLTHWAEIVGTDVARAALPVKVNYGRGGLGATLTVLTTGAQAPMLQADLPRIKDKVNACYGYAAISRIRITQTAPVGFHEGQVAFSPAPKSGASPVKPETRAKAQEFVTDVGSEDLRMALEKLGENILSRSKS